jgi:hypothetical protein
MPTLHETALHLRELKKLAERYSQTLDAALARADNDWDATAQTFEQLAGAALPLVRVLDWYLTAKPDESWIMRREAKGFDWDNLVGGSA